LRFPARPDILSAVKRLAIPSVGLLVVLAIAPGASGQGGLLSGVLRNETGLCGAPEALTVQISGNDLSPRLSVPADRPVTVALPRGLYSVMVLRADGSLLEESATLVMSPDFVVTVGCAGIPKPLEPPKEGAEPSGVAVRLVNTTGDCGDPRTVDFQVDRRPVGPVADGREMRALVPATSVVVDVLNGGRRLLTYSVSRPRAGQALAFGCTFPDSAGSTEGVPVAFENTTDQCPDAASQRALTLWVDGLPVTGLAPGKKTGVRVQPGRHDFEVRVGWSRARVVRGAKDVSSSFRIHYGCGK